MRPLEPTAAASTSRGRPSRRRGPDRPQPRPLAAAAGLALLLLLPAAAAAAGNGLTALFEKANQAYHEGRFEEAREAYEELLHQDVVDGRLFYNLGDTYYQLGDLGRAMLYYLRAQRLLPRDPDVRANIALLRRATQPDDAPQEPFWVLRIAGAPYFYLSRNEQVTLALISLWILALALAARILSRHLPHRRRAGAVALLAAAVLTYTAASYGIARYRDANHPPAVILEADTTGRSGPGEDFTEMFRAQPGTEVTIHNRRPGWVQVALPNDLVGWVPESAVEPVPW
jgi:tetratricopeptide (TPR) repeat protein